MARPLRINIPGGIYHVIARGNDREQIVRDDIDRQRFLQVLARVVDRFSWLCHAYSLLDNHYHLVVETPLPNLPGGMRQLNGRHAQSFNVRHQRTGHLFESRYRSILVEKETYLLELCRYVVLNPVRARLCQAPHEWPWSSYNASAGLETAPPLLAFGELLALFGIEPGHAVRSFRDFVRLDMS